MTMKMKRGFLAAAVLGLVAAATPSAQELPLERLTLPDGFHIEVYASGVKNARQMALTPDGTLFVGSHGAGNVYAVVDDDDDFRADRVVTIATALSMPSGLAFRDGSLYVGAVSRILRFDDIESRLDNPPEPVVITDGLPAERHHGWKYLGFGPDGMLYAPVGGPCNICDRTDEDPRYATILRMNPDGSGEEIFAHGVRNSVGFDWQPGTNDGMDSSRWCGIIVPVVKRPLRATAEEESRCNIQRSPLTSPSPCSKWRSRITRGVWMKSIG